MLVVGNIYKDEAIALARTTEETISARPLTGIGPVDLSLELPEGMSQSLLIYPFDNRGLVQVPIMFGPSLFPTPMNPTLL